MEIINASTSEKEDVKNSALYYFTSFISYVFHPLFAPIIGAYILLNSNLYISYTLPSASKNIIYTLLFINTIMAPGLAIYFLLKKNIITHINLPKNIDRIIALIIIGVFYWITYYIFKSKGQLGVLTSFVIGISISSLISLLISNFFKISLHAIAAGGLIGLVYAICQINNLFTPRLMFGTIFLSSVICFSRLYLQAHKPREVYFGIVIGFISIFISLNYGLG